MSTERPAVKTLNATKTEDKAVVAEPVKKQETNPKRLRDTTSDWMWTVIGLKDCPWTAKAVTLLKEHGERVKYIELNSEWQRRITVDVGTRRIPAVFKGAAYFGSFNDLSSYYMCSFIADDETF